MSSPGKIPRTLPALTSVTGQQTGSDLGKRFLVTSTELSHDCVGYQERRHVILVSLATPEKFAPIRRPPRLCVQMANLRALSDRGSIQPSQAGALPDGAGLAAAPRAI